MDLGFWALLFGLAAAGALALVPADWMKAAGGLLILVTIAAMALQLLGLA